MLRITIYLEEVRNRGPVGNLVKGCSKRRDGRGPGIQYGRRKHKISCLEGKVKDKVTGRSRAKYDEQSICLFHLYLRVKCRRPVI